MPSPPPQRRFAVLIDADNVSAKALEGLLAEVANYGTAMVKRIYGDWTTPSLNSWKPMLLEHIKSSARTHVHAYASMAMLAPGYAARWMLASV